MVNIICSVCHSYQDTFCGNGPVASLTGFWTQIQRPFPHNTSLSVRKYKMLCFKYQEIRSWSEEYQMVAYCSGPKYIDI